MKINPKPSVPSRLTATRISLFVPRVLLSTFCFQRFKFLLFPLALAVATGAQATTYFWDGGTTDIAITGNAASDPAANGSWNTTTKNWDQSPSGSAHIAWPNSSSDTAAFAGTARTVTVGSVNVGTITVGTATYTFSSGTINFPTAGGIIDVGTTTGHTFSSALAGKLTYNATGNTTTTSQSGGIGSISGNNTGLTSFELNTGGAGNQLLVSSAGALGPASSPVKFTQGVAGLSAANGTLYNSWATTFAGGCLRLRVVGSSTYQGNGTLTANSDFATIAAATLVYSGTLDLGVNTLTLAPQTAASGAITLNGAISGSGNLTINNSANGNADGLGTVTLGTANPLFTGTATTTAGKGTLALNNVNALQAATLNTGASSGSQAVTFVVSGNNTYNLGALTGSDDLAMGANSISVGAKLVDTAFSGAITGSGGVTKTGANTLTLNAVNTYSGDTTIAVSGGTLKIASAGQLNNGSYAGHIAIGSSGTFNYNSSAAQTLSGLIDGAGTFQQSGAGTVTISGTLSAATIVAGGTLAVTAGTTAGTPAVTVNDAGTLSITVADPSQWAPSSLTLGSVNGCNLKFSNVKLGSTTAPLAPTSVTVHQTTGITVNILSVNGTLATGSYPLLANTGLPDGAQTVYLVGTQPAGVTASSLTVTSGTLYYNITGIADIWNAASPGANWDISTTAVWAGNAVNNTTPNTYKNSDNVLFNDSVGSPQTVTVAALVTPGAIAVVNSSTAYTIASSGANLIGGTGALTKSGNASLALSGGVNTFSGSVTLNGGTVSVSKLANGGAASDIGSSANSAANLTINGATLQYSGAGDTSDRLFTMGLSGATLDASGSGALNLNNASSVVLASGGARTFTLTGTSTAANTLAAVVGDSLGVTSLTKSGAGWWTLTGNNNYTGSTLISGGTLALSGSGSLGSGTALTLGGGALDLGTMSKTVGAVSITAAAASGDTIKNGSLTGTSYAASLTSGNAIVSANLLANGSIGVSMSGSGGTLTLAGNNTYTGPTTISAGTVKAGSATALGNASTLTMSGTATLDLNGNSFTVANSTAGASTVTVTDTGTGTGTDTLSITNLTSSPAYLIQDGATRKVAVAINNLNSTGGGPANPNNTYSGGTILLGNGTANGSRLNPPAGSTISGGKGIYGTGPIYIGQTGSDKAQIYLNTSSGTTIANEVVVNSVLGTDIGYPLRVETANVISGKITANTNVVIGNNNGITSPGLTISGQITGAAGLILFNSAKSIPVTLANTGTPNNYQGNTTVSGASDTLILGAADQIPNGVNAGSLVISSGGSFNMAGYGETVNGLTGAGTVDNVTAANANNTLTLGDGNATGNTFSGVIKNTAGSLALTKIGTGTQTLTGVNLYSGATTINAGKLVGQVNGSCANSAVTVVATSGNTAYLSVSITDTTKQWTCASVTINNTLNGGTTSGLDFNFGALTPSTTVAPLNVSGAVSFTTPPTVTIEAGSLPISSGNGYPLLTWGSGSAPSLAGITLSLPTSSRAVGNLAIVGSTLYLQITSTTEPLNWIGGNGTWDTSALNWKDSATPTPNTTAYIDGTPGDAVIFDNTVGSGGTVTLNNTFTPASVTVNNPSTDYTISGNGLIAGSTTTLTKTGGGKLTLATGANTYGGGTAVKAGTLALTGGNNRIVSTGAVTLGDTGTSGKLVLGDSSAAVNQTVASLADSGLGGSVVGGNAALSGLTINNASTLTTSSALTIGGPGANENNLWLAKSGAGTLTLAGNNTYSGGTTNSGGILTAANNSAFGSGTLTINTGTTRLVVNDGVTIANNITINGGGASFRGLIENSGAGNATLSGGTITINGALAGGNFFASASGGTLTVADPITSASTTVGSRVGTVIFSGGGSYANFIINDGTAKLGANNGLSTSATVDLGPTSPATPILDLGGFNQTLVGVTRSNNGNTSSIGNSSTTSDSVLTITGTSTYSGVIKDILGSGTKKLALTMNGGTLTLSGANTYSGNTTITSGTLALSGSGSVANTAQISIASGATFGVSAVTPSGFSLNSSGTLVLNINKSGATLTQGQVVLGAKNLTYAGALTVNASGDALTSGNSFTLFATNGTANQLSGWFSTVSLPALSSGLAWDTNKLATSGVLDIYNFSTTTLAIPTLMNTPAVISAFKLGLQASSERGTPLAISASTPAHGTANISAGALTYTPANNYTGSDTFTVTYADGHGTQSATVNVTINAENTGPALTGVNDGNGYYRITTTGLANTIYDIQAQTTDNNVTGDWTTLSTATAAPNGVIIWTDSELITAHQARIYRLKQH